MDDRQFYDTLRAHIAEKIPGFAVGFKTENTVSKILGVLAYPFNPRYMQDYTTTRFPRVFFPSRAFVEENPRRAWKILAHEFVHLWDRQQRGLAFNLGYSFPQILAVLALSALLAIWLGPWALFGLVPLLALAPLPAPWRKEAERRGYSMSMAVNGWRYGDVRESTKTWIAEQFTGAPYYFMWPFPESVAAFLDAAERDILSGDLFEWDGAEPYRQVHGLLQAAGWNL